MLPCISNQWPTLVTCAFVVLTILSNVQVTHEVSVEEDLALTQSQINALGKFRKNVEHLLYRDFMKTDIYLIRWLRARDFDISAAETMLRSHLNWRRTQKVDEILKEDWSEMRKDFHASIDTYDKQGRPIGVIDIYDWDIRACILRGRGPLLVRYINSLLENITMQVFDRQGMGLNVTQWKVLANADQFNAVEHACAICLPIWLQLVQTLEYNFPGWLDEFIIVEAPTAINIVLEVVRPFLSRNTRQALKIFGPNKSKWLPYLEQRIDKKERRPQYGGSKPPSRE